ncbi:MAG: NAD(P)H-dependent glycerol-3-phosphate dehydrogenase [Anaerostipes sp.]|uniref:NAD(P)H-dependent glycerol-3-phosphate dehydrogenase n=1 Tax=Anaerostipes sp. 992a TaxID=1261637 RepID=UPI000952FBF3|nr:NAD(P)H-dependent glycerol-3-phosphate dehydrogenase [Anaerostipes sp. 992a]MCI5952196.1 NAD(P)H-dependent glycerol-3-phosphate dehydrogenase [Anaerostipes sp.]MDD5968499.1 NAD(P)H-dependent glycerol-3-phosphate dehydrogenase [Anaerostipes sp.]OLR63839.1 glycerol-3-phosphate dehydrogenase [Anaerostipes sp. 992a]
MEHITVLGAGSWGTALSVVLAQNGHQVMLWSHREEEAKRMQEEREQASKLPGVLLPENITVTGNMEAALKGNDAVILAVPSTAIRSTAAKLREYVPSGQMIVCVAKGIEDETFLTLTEIIEEEIPGVRACVLSGPSHAEEVGRQMPTTVVAGAKKKEDALYIQDIFMNSYFRVYTSPDVIGIEMGGALKNVIALAAGIADGLGYGDNSKAALITRGISELTRLGTALGGKTETFSGLTGVGDLIVTCTSIHSRNHRAGELIGKGYTAKEAMDEVKMVVEGVNSAKAALKLARKKGVNVPIIEKINAVLFEDKKAEDAVKELLMRDRRKEFQTLKW